MTIKKLNFYQPMLGTDAEFFFTNKSGDVIGAEKVIDPDKGYQAGQHNSKIIVDGVQGEINPSPSHCREVLGKEIARMLYSLKELTEEKGIDASFMSMSEVTEDEFKSLSSKSQQFGCSPSYNVHNGCSTSKIDTDPTKDRNRSCGGHIHLGIQNISLKTNAITTECMKCNIYKKLKNEISCWKHASGSSATLNNYLGKIFSYNGKDDKLLLKDIKSNFSEYTEDEFKRIETAFKSLDLIVTRDTTVQLTSNEKALNKHEQLINLMDVIVGIPSVLVDRDPYASNRRKYYGKAGEFRWQPHGIEYRTLSNFWLNSYQLFSLFMGLARLPLIMLKNDIDNNDDYYERLILDKVDLKEVAKAINTNDFKLAKKIFLQVEGTLVELMSHHSDHMPFYGKGLDAFKYVVITGYKNLFDNVFTEWSKYVTGELSGVGGHGWESYSKKLSSNKKLTDINEKFLAYEGE